MTMNGKFRLNITKKNGNDVNYYYYVYYSTQYKEGDAKCIDERELFPFIFFKVLTLIADQHFRP